MDNEGWEGIKDRSDLKRVISSYDRFVPYKLFELLGKKSITHVSLGDQIELNLTILFSDIRDFTALSETLTPRENFEFINSYLSQMETLISAHNGIVDKYIGDAIMAVFSEGAVDALNCSILMLKQLRNYNKGRERAGYVPINIGIGLNTGISMLGTIGGPNRMEGTVISDAVNVASRLESLTKTYGIQLLISENTYYSIPLIGKYCTRFIDRVSVKGKIQPLSIYEVYDNDGAEGISLKNRTKAMFEEALANYHYRRIDKAVELLKRCLEANPNDNPAKTYLRRCELYSSTGSHEGARELSQQLEWNARFNIGIAEVDQQHYELFSKLSALLQCVERGYSGTEAGEILTFLEDYVLRHFKTEEAFMAESGYPFLHHQKEQHARFMKTFIQLKAEIGDASLSPIYVMFRVQIFLIDWLVNHTLKEDRHFGKFLKHREQ